MIQKAEVRRFSRLAGAAVSHSAVKDSTWIDVVNPSPEEDQRLMERFGIDLPTREEMEEIESSSRVYEEAGTLYMTAILLQTAGELGTDSQEAQALPVSFVLTPDNLVTVRFSDLAPFRQFSMRYERFIQPQPSSDALFALLMDIIVDTTADMLEDLGEELERLSRDVFRVRVAEKTKKKKKTTDSVPALDLDVVVQRIGRLYDTASKVRESLLTLGRVISFAQAAAPWMSDDVRSKLRTADRDIRSLAEHGGYLSQKTNFLLDATLGLINNQQNKIIKIFSVVSVAFLPPTLVASSYGMNFAHMPELNWSFGYPFSLGVMVISGLLPYLFFKRKGWL